jgi:hypothetical protein
MGSRGLVAAEMYSKNVSGFAEIFCWEYYRNFKRVCRLGLYSHC